MGQTINGREVAAKIKEDIKKFISDRIENGLKTPKIASILVGDDGGSIYYMNNQEKVANSLGCGFEKVILNNDVSDDIVIKAIEKLNKDEFISGIILQLPLPKGLDENKIIQSINPCKDIDCLTYINQGKLYMGEKSFIPCTPNSIVTLIESLNINLEGKEVVVIGRSNIVGKPVAQLLLNKNCTVTICHSKTKNIKEVTKRADIIVVAIGKPLYLKNEYIKTDAIIIDVGTSSYEGKITGDVDFNDVIDKASFVTPVPGGVGALTTTLLIKNACEALEKNEN
ncbi:bifunctional methylenetetrahydrofolate dehydrogenase/methenyltetrahydrofolate cyclohydrolase [Clostridium carnis]